MSQRCQGFLGDYHSKLALVCYMRGLDVNTAISLYRDETYAAANYFEVFRESALRLKRGDERSDFRIADQFFEQLSKKAMLLSTNHPTSFYFYMYGRQIAAGLAEHGISRVNDLPWDPLLYPNSLAKSAIFPVYPEIGLKNALAYMGSYFFKSEDLPTKRGRMLTLSEFVCTEYEAFQVFGSENIKATPHWSAVATQFAEVILQH